MTGSKEPGITPDQWQAYQNVLADGGLTVRAFVLWLTGDSFFSATTVDDAQALVSRISVFTKPYVRVTHGDAEVQEGPRSATK